MSQTRRVSRRGIAVKTRLLSSCGGVSVALASAVRRLWAKRRSCASPYTRRTLQGAPQPSALLWTEGAHDVRPEGILPFEVFGHRRVTHPRPRACPRAGHATPPSSGSRRSREVCSSGRRSRPARDRGSTRGSAPPGGPGRAARGRKLRRSPARARRWDPPPISWDATPHRRSVPGRGDARSGPSPGCG